MASFGTPGAGWTAYGVFAILGGLALLVGGNAAAPGCTGPAVASCDYVASAKNAVNHRQSHRFQRDLGFEIFDQGSSVLVQQFTPPGEPSLNHASSALIDKKSCRVCQVSWHYPTGQDPLDPYVGALLLRVPADDREAAARRARHWEGGPGGTSLL